MTNKNLTCYLCGHDKFGYRNGTVRDNPGIKIVECMNCGMVMLDSLGHICEGHYEDSGMHGEVPLPIEIWLRETELDDQRRFEMLKTSIADRKILDFGCGAAGFLHRVRGLAREAAGVEVERRVRDYWGKNLKIFGSLDEADKDYDLLTAFHVFEHLPDPREMLKSLARHLKAGGRIVLEVPSSEDALLTLYDNAAFQNFTYWSQHLFLFNAETLRLLARQAGLQVIAIQQFQHYPLSNHLHWLSRGKPGGHQKWAFLDSPVLNEAYAASLAAIGKCDTLIGYFERG